LTGEPAAEPEHLASQGAMGRADLLCAYLEQGREGMLALAGRLGYEPVEIEPRERVEAPAVAGTRKAPPARDLQPTPPPTRFRPIPFWRPVAREWADDASPAEEPERSTDELTVEDSRPEDAEPPPAAPIAAWPRLRRHLDEALRTTHRGHEIDADELVRRWSRGEVVREIPRRRGFSQARVALILDDNPRLAPFRDDQLELAATLYGRLARGMLRLLPPASRSRDRAVRPAEDEVVLALSDLGAYGNEAAQEGWKRYGRTLQDRGGRLVALLPCPAHRWPRSTATLWSGIDWSAPTARAWGASDPETRNEAVARLLAAISPALRVEAGLLRELRQIVGPPADLGTEADVWSHPEVQGGTGVAISLDPERSAAWQRRFAALEPALKTEIARAILRWHRGLPWEIRAVEIAQLQAGGVPAEVLDFAEVQKAEEWFQRAALTLKARKPESSALGSGLDGYLQRATRRTAQTTWTLPGYRAALARVVRILQARHEGAPLPVGVTPEMLEGSDPDLPIRRLTVWHEGDRLRVRPPEEPGRGSPLATISAREPRLAVLGGDRPAAEVDLEEQEKLAPWPPGVVPVTLVTDLETVTLEPLEDPGWAVATGRDRYGLWADFKVEGVTQRMRWIAPGRFWMGSPEDEEGRWDDEGPRHLVELTSGFWLADTPCTQELYATVMGNNPSRFQSPRRPVEQVSWNDCEVFFEHLKKKEGGIEARFPTEAEWEYACRAGTETATWEGDLKIRGECNAPLLDEVAWYSGNSGVDLDLAEDEAEDSSGWPEKQYPHKRAATREIGLKRPNPWGLYDMLGNVFEWCSDWWQVEYPSGPAVDPKGPDSGSHRVDRDGSWRADARSVRAASRSWAPPGYRWNDLGFRLARGQDRGALESGRRAGGRAARDEPPPPAGRPDGPWRGEGR